MIAMQYAVACFTLIDPNREGHGLLMPTHRTGLRCIGWWNLHHTPCSLLRFQAEVGEEHRPGHIGDGFRKSGFLTMLRTTKASTAINPNREISQLTCW